MKLVSNELFDDIDQQAWAGKSVGICVAVVCRESFMREAIREALLDSGLELVHGVATLEALGERRHGCNAVLYVEPSEDDAQADNDIEFMRYMQDQNWIVMARDRDSRFFWRLAELGANVSVIPFDVSRGDLAHLARLAANQRRVFVDQFCETSRSADAGFIKSADLTSGQMHLLRLLSEGFSNKEIALREKSAENTVKMRVRALLAKLQVSNRTRAAVIAARAGFRLDMSSEHDVPQAQRCRTERGEHDGGLSHV